MNTIQTGFNVAFGTTFNHEKELLPRPQRQQHSATKRELLQKHVRNPAGRCGTWDMPR